MNILNLIQGDMKTCRANVLCSLSSCRLSAFPYIFFPSLKLETLGKSSHQNVQTVKISALAFSSGMLPQCTNGKHFDRKRNSFFKRVKQWTVSPVNGFTDQNVKKKSHGKVESWSTEFFFSQLKKI